ncbi:hypothetical protein DFQ27_004148 [Actinomortierella ambigua]|uniref:Uncharacterized protein n=1 Tax=Actinomortierella ambigua TaxID=1343610 RepID=A0A9P6QK79_9FUNG|nr:hypothetical protein DFQ27_004148 [Actinomortierella ambigua]
MGASAASTSSSSPTTPPPLPAKLRWRPYKNGTSVKSKSARIEQEEAARAAKNLASKVRSQQYYANKQHSPVELNIQWEEAETLETMSHGGLPINHPHGGASADSNSSRHTSPAASSRAGSFSSPSSSPSPTSTKLDFVVDGAPALAQLRASLPVFSGSDPQQVLATAQLSNSTAYQVALELLLQNHRQQNANTALLQPSNNTMEAAANTTKALPPFQQPPPILSASLFGLDMPSLSNPMLSEPPRKLSNANMMDITDVDELLASCGFLDQATMSAQSSTKSASSPGFLSGYLASPDMSDQSLATSPMSDVIDFAGSQGTSPLPSFAPLGADGLTFEALLDSKALAPSTSINSASITPPSSQDSYNDLILHLASPFAAPTLDTSKVGNGLLASTTTASAAWPSLFPGADSSSPSMVQEVVKQPSTIPGRSEISTQTSSPYLSPHSPTFSFGASNTSTNGQSPESGIDPDWLNFLDEASLSEADLAALLSDTEVSPAGSPTFSSQQQPQDARAGSRSLWTRASDALKGTNSTTSTDQQQRQQQQQQSQGEDPFAAAAGVSGSNGHFPMSSLPGGSPSGHRGVIPMSGSLGSFHSQPNGLITSLSKRPQRIGLHTKPMGMRTNGEGEDKQVGEEDQRTKEAEKGDKPELELRETQRQQGNAASPKGTPPEPPSSILSKAPGSKVPVGREDGHGDDVGGLLSMLKSWWSSVKPF